MKYIVLFLGMIVISVALTACSMDTTGGFNRGGRTMDGKDIYEPGDLPIDIPPITAPKPQQPPAY